MNKEDAVGTLFLQGHVRDHTAPSVPAGDAKEWNDLAASIDEQVMGPPSLNGHKIKDLFNAWRTKGVPLQNFWKEPGKFSDILLDALAKPLAAYTTLRYGATSGSPQVHVAPQSHTCLYFDPSSGQWRIKFNFPLIENKNATWRFWTSVHLINGTNVAPLIVETEYLITVQVDAQADTVRGLFERFTELNLAPL
ncbi:MAG: hypothetical protein EYC70_09295 [Planctomycetota bacterium]|nr:MAG: hypothetical protein EYC70_09295 [Planctomycetota bacterium]